MRLFSAMRDQESVGLLRQVADRNVSVEVHFERAGFLYVGKSRLLSLGEQEVVIERPTYSVPNEGLTTEQLVTVYFQVGGTRYAFQTLVRQPRLLFPLNEDTRVPALTLDVPAEVEKNQRRQHFRIGVGGRHDIPIYFHDAETVDADAIPIDAERFKGRMVDVSVGGVRAVVTSDQRSHFRLGERFFVSFELPGVAGGFSPLCRVCYLKSIRDGESHQVGMQFIPWSGFSIADEHYRLNAFIAAEQRRQRQRLV